MNLSGLRHIFCTHEQFAAIAAKTCGIWVSDGGRSEGRRGGNSTCELGDQEE